MLERLIPQNHPLNGLASRVYCNCSQNHWSLLEAVVIIESITGYSMSHLIQAKDFVSCA